MPDITTEAALTEWAQKARRLVIEMLLSSRSGHPGSSLSTIEILISLYFKVLQLDHPDRRKRDKFLLSKGHAAPALYAVFMLKKILPEAYKDRLRKGGSPLQGHPDERFLPDLDFSSGSLGQNLSVGVGYALAQKKSQLHTSTYVLLGDGELQEGQIWEAALCAAHYRLNHLTAIVDYNKLQLDGPIDSVMSLGDIYRKWDSFGWDVTEVDGHHFPSLLHAFHRRSDRPKCIIAHTVKGKGVSFMENVTEWHSLHQPDPEEDLRSALQELKGGST